MKTLCTSIACLFCLLVVGCSEPTVEQPKTTATIDGTPEGSPDSAKPKSSAKTDTEPVEPSDSKSLVVATDPVEKAADKKPPVKTDESQPDPQGIAKQPSNGNGEKGLAEIGSGLPDEGLNVRADDGLPPTRLPADLLGADVRPLNKQGTVLIDVPRKKIFLKTNVSLRTGALEMLVCLKQTKEHESIVSIDSKAFMVHTALVALGMKEGKASYWKKPENEDDDPTFVPAEGQKVDIFVHWRDTKGKLHRERAQQWIRHTINRYYDEQFEALPADLKLVEDENLRWDELNKTLFWYGPMSAKQRDELLARSKHKKYQATINQFHKQSQPREMKADFLFVGSGFHVEDNERHYLAEGGCLICVANFNMAMIDISTESNSQGESLTYEAYTERIPPRKSDVIVELVPVFEPKPDADSKTETKQEKKSDAKATASEKPAE
jgi:hypothetical protein